MKRMMPAFVVFSATLLCLAFSRPSQPSTYSSLLTEPDTVFLAEAASSSKMEITLGNLAQEKAISEDVKRFGTMMVRDHTLATSQLLEAARAIGFTPPDTMLPKHSRHVEHLQGVSGDKFDKQYMEMMVEAHKDDIDEFKDAAKEAKAEAVRRFASVTLPVLQMHRDSARIIREKIR